MTTVIMTWFWRRLTRFAGGYRQRAICMPMTKLLLRTTRRSTWRGKTPSGSRMHVRHSIVSFATPTIQTKTCGGGVTLCSWRQPVVRMSAITGDRKYIVAMDREWSLTQQHLYNPEQKLFYRDATYIGKHEQNGANVYWTGATAGFWPASQACSTPCPGPILCAASMSICCETWLRESQSCNRQIVCGSRACSIQSITLCLRSLAPPSLLMGSLGVSITDRSTVRSLAPHRARMGRHASVRIRRWTSRLYPANRRCSRGIH